MSSTPGASGTSRYSWWALWLGVSALLLLGLAGFIALPLALESSPGERAEAFEALWRPISALVSAVALAALGSWMCARQVPR